MASSCFVPFSITVATVVFFLFFCTSSLAAVDRHSNRAPLQVISIGSQVRQVPLSPVLGDLATDGTRNSSGCSRVKVEGISRLKLFSYASLFYISLDTSAAISKKLDSKIHVCFQSDDSVGWCQCQKDKWSSLQKGTWSAAMSPFENRYVDIRFNGQIPVSVTISLVEDLQERFLVCLVLGYVLLLFGPLISSWVLFYWSHPKAIGVFLVTIILLFQLGAESFPSRHFSVIVNYILQTLGFGEEMRDLVAIFLLLGIIVSGSGLIYWIVRRFVISREDATLDADFVKWAMYIMGLVFIFQSTEDHLLALGVLIFCAAVFYLIRKRLRVWYEIANARYSLQQARGTCDHAESFSKSTGTPMRSACSDSPTRGVLCSHSSPSMTARQSVPQQVYKRKKFRMRKNHHVDH